MLHEEREALSKLTLDLQRATDSLEEELQATDWYRQRAEACNDEELKKILIHNMNEEKEHAAMLMEWIKRHDKEFDEEFRKYLNSEPKGITEME